MSSKTPSEPPSFVAAISSATDDPGSRYEYRTPGNLSVHRSIDTIDGSQEFSTLLKSLDQKKGVLLASSYEFPGRYTRMDIGFCSPPLQISARQREVKILANNPRGQVLLEAISGFLDEQKPNYISQRSGTDSLLQLSILEPPRKILEEERTRIPSVFSLIRTLLHCFFHPQEPWLGFYGAFGYDLAFQCDPIEEKIKRPQDHRDLVLYLPDTIIELDHARKTALRVEYEFEFEGRNTQGLDRATSDARFFPNPNDKCSPLCDHSDDEYKAVVQSAHEYFAYGDLFETVPSRSFIAPCLHQPSEIFERLRKNTPAPFGLFLNLGEEEFLIGASPEMYLRTQGRRIETCPIAGTIARGSSPVGDAEQIRRLLNSKKEEAELTMCTDVDRNDKSRVCVPGSVRVIGRRQIEMYSKLIHTVDHVEGVLLDSYDSLDAFISHMWAVTVTGAPKLAAMQFIEDHEKSHRSWYAGAVGKLGFDGNINTGLTLRTIQVHRGTAEVRAGATLLFDSEPQAEADETRLKASALLDALDEPSTPDCNLSTIFSHQCTHQDVMLVDHRDSFVHTLANYIRQTGAKVRTIRAGFDRQRFDQINRNVDLLVLSPGPGRPDDFNCKEIIGWSVEKRIPIFGVCLGLQAIFEYFGGSLETLPVPVHGKPSLLRHENLGLFSGMPENLSAGRYHSLVASNQHVPPMLRVTARAQDDEAIMGIEHKELPIAAVQFHPESILSDHGKFGIELIRQAMTYLSTLSYP